MNNSKFNIKNSKLFPRSEFSRHVLTLMTGTTIAQAIPIAISPILTRIYTPEDFGAFAIYIAIASVLSILATGKYELAIMLPQKDEDAFAIMLFSIASSFAISILSFLAIYLFHHQLINFFEKKEIVDWLYLIPLSIILSALYQNLRYWSNRGKEYKVISKAIILQSSTNGAGNVLFGLMGFSFVGMIVSNMLSSMFSVLYFLFKNIKYTSRYKKAIDFRQIIAIAKQYKQFPLQTLPQNFLYQAYLQIPIIAIKALFSLATLGFFTLAYRVIATPLSILSNSLGEVFYQKASLMYINDKKSLQVYIKSLFTKLLGASLFIGGIIVWFLPELFSFIFGNNWIEAGKIGQYLMIYLIFDFALTPFTRIYLIANRNILYLKWEIVRFISVVLLCLIFYWAGLFDSSLFFIAFALLNLLLYIVLAIPILNKKSFIWREI